MTIKELFKSTIEREASDLHLICGYYPTMRINNDLIPLKIDEIMTQEKVEKMVFSLLSEEQKENLLSNKEIDLGLEYEGFRLRANIYYTKNQLAAAFRVIPSNIKTIDDLKLPPVFHTFTQHNHGLVLITGPTGEG